MTVSSHYSEQVVAFIDILGFAQLVQRMDSDRRLIDEIYTVLSRVGEEDVSSGFGDWVREGPARLTVASNSILFSISFDDWAAAGKHGTPGWACLAALESIFWLQRYLLRRGILTRGGVAVGSLLHYRNVIFGPALVHAYRIESQLALYPRVIVDPQVVDEIRHIEIATHFTFPSRLEAVVTRDADGQTFIDYLHYNAIAIQDLNLPAQLFSDIRENIQAALLASRGDIRVYQKVAWLASYFNRSRSRWLAEPDVSQSQKAFDGIALIELV